MIEGNSGAGESMLNRRGNPSCIAVGRDRNGAAEVHPNKR